VDSAKRRASFGQGIPSAGRRRRRSGRPRSRRNRQDPAEVGREHGVGECAAACGARAWNLLTPACAGPTAGRPTLSSTSVWRRGRRSAVAGGRKNPSLRRRGHGTGRAEGGSVGAKSSPKAGMPRPKSVRRDAERGGRDARAPQTPAFRRFNVKCMISKDAAGEGAGHHTRGRVCSPEPFAAGFRPGFFEEEGRDCQAWGKGV
jgi:hypothetical protein